MGWVTKAMGESVADVLSRLGVAATGGILFMLVSVANQPPGFTPHRLEILERQAIPAGCPVTAVLSYYQKDPAVVTLGLFFARMGRETAVPHGMYDLPAGEHVVGFYVEVPRWLPPGDYKVYLLWTRIGWFGRPESVRVESSRFQIAPPTGGPCPQDGALTP